MQLVRNGPDVPDPLLQAHEEGCVVFFCGAGISYPAGLPGFGGLVETICKNLRYTRTSIEDRAFIEQRYDATVDLIERRIHGGRLAVRRALASALTPKLRRKGAARTHEALLTLARTNAGEVRLVTTNFDRIFEFVMTRTSALRVPTFAAPLLPIAKNSRWHGLVYLHGLLPKKEADHEALQRLVVSSGDFGLAYLTERWAARFVGELFRNYIVCFVGYSIADPVLRYMMDALAADRRLGEVTPPAYAFGGFKAGDEDQQRIEWEARGVTPVLYEILSGKTPDHSLLHETIVKWAETHREGSTGKERIVAEYAISKPTASTQQDNYVGRMLWALSDKRALAAKRFAEFDPCPALDWLEPFAEQRFGHRDLVRFHVTPDAEEDAKLKFSLLGRPTPYRFAPWMQLVQGDVGGREWDTVMFQMARWLVRHLDDPKLLLWICGRGSSLNPAFAHLISDELEKRPPSKRMQTLWSVVLAGRVRTTLGFTDLYQWFAQLKRAGSLTLSLRVQLHELLQPRVTFKPPFRLFDETDENSAAESERIRDVVEWEVVLGTDYVHAVLAEALGSPVWMDARAELLSDFTDLLRDAMDLMRELQGADEESDFSYIHHPSISDHPQNQRFHDWTALIDLLRDAWLAASERDEGRARLEVERWQSYRYPIFRRMTFFAATSSVIAPGRGLSWLLDHDRWWLWSPETQRETLQLLLVLPPRLNEAERAELEEAILAGPPRAKFKADLTDERWGQLVGREIWLLLTQWERSGLALRPKASAILERISQQNPEWKREGERDEFAVWMGSGEDWREPIATPTKYRELVSWLREHPEPDFKHPDVWAERCRDNLRKAAVALIRLAREGKWPPERWREALQTWASSASDDPSAQVLHSRSWRYVATTLAEAPDELLLKASHSIVWWLRSIAKSGSAQEEIWVVIIQRLIAIHRDEPLKTSDDPVGAAINHPVGQLIEAMLEWWFRKPRQDQEGIAEPTRRIFTDVCDVSVESYRHGRVVLVSRLITLFRVDPEWSRQYLLPLLDWDLSESEARVAWEAFLWSPRLYAPLFELIKKPFLSAARHYDALGKHREQYAAFLTFVALNRGETFTAAELAVAMEAFPPEGLLRAANTLVRLLEGAGEQRAEYWNQKVVPYLDAIWPGSTVVVTPALSATFARLCVVAGTAFPQALARLESYLQPLESTFSGVRDLKESKLAAQYPEEALAFLSKIIREQSTRWISRDLDACLTAIGETKPALKQDARFRRLSEAARGV